MAKPGTFSAENQPKNRRGPDKRTLLLNAIKQVCGKDEQGFWVEIVTRAMNPNDPASSQLMKEIATRLYPQSKPTMPVVDFQFRKNGTPAERVDDISNAVADGVLPVDVAKVMVDIIKTGLDIQDVTELAERLERLEKHLAEAQADK